MDNNHKILEKKAPLDRQLDGNYSLVMGPQPSSDFLFRITIAIPTYRRPELLIQAIRSALDQKTNHPYQIIVIDNDDSDEFRDKVNDCVRQMQSPLISLYRNHKNIGMFGNWNRCLLLAKTEWVSILNDDDILSPSYVECICDIADYLGDAGLIQVGYRIFDMRKSAILPSLSQWSNDGSQGISSVKKLSFQNLCLGNTRSGSLGIAYRKDIALNIGGFDAQEYPTADYCFHARLLANGCVAYNVEAPLAIYRILENESLKPEVLASFVANDYKLRIEASAWMRSNLAMILYARSTAIAQANSLEKVWGVSIKFDCLEERLGFKITRSISIVYLARALSAFLRRLLT